MSDTTIIPLYPRRKVRSVCNEAVSGEITVADTVGWKGVRGRVAVRVDALVGGEDRRDMYARRAILESNQYPEVAYQIDSLVGVTRKGDTLIGTAMGVYTMHGVSQPMKAAIKFWQEAGGVRVMGKFYLNAEDLVPIYGLSKFALGLGVGARVWIHLWQGVDLLLVPAGSSGN